MMRIAKYAALAASVLAASTMIASSAGARAPGIMYHRTFYSDATLTTQVGWYRDGCWNGNVVASPVQGVTSPTSPSSLLANARKRVAATIDRERSRLV